MRQVRLIFLLLLPMSLAACGGGGGVSYPPLPTLPPSCENMQHLAAYPLQHLLRDLHVTGGHAFAAAGSGTDGSFRIIDISNPSAPVETGSLPLPFVPTGLHVFPPYTYIAVDNALLIVDVSNPRSPRTVGQYSFPERADLSDVYVLPPFAYLLVNELSEDARLQILDVSNPTTPQPIGFVGLPVSIIMDSRVVVHLPYAYVLEPQSSLFIIDVSNPHSPRQVGMYSVAAESVQVSRQYAYAAGLTAMWAIDVSNPATPRTVGTYSGTFADIHINGSYAYLLTFTAVTTAAIEVVDISNPANLRRAGYCEGSGVLSGGGLNAIWSVGAYAYGGTTHLNVWRFLGR